MRLRWEAVVLMALACGSVTSRYDRASQKDTVEAYRDFLRRHPGSEYEEVARRRLDDLMFAEAREDGTVDALAAYVENSVISYHRREADSLLQRALILENSVALRDSLEETQSAALAVELGNALAELGEGVEAAERFEEAGSLGADSFDVSVGLARSYSLMGEDTRAIAEFQRAMRLRSSSPWPYVYLARHYRRRAQHTKALGAYLEAVQRSPEDADLRFELGLAYLDVPNPAEAVRVFKRLAESESEDIDALYWVGIAYADMGDSDLAVLWLRRYLAQVRELGDQAAVEHTEAKIRQVRPAAATSQAKVIPGQTYKNQEKKQEQRSSGRQGWTRTPWGGTQRRGRGDPWDR